MINMCKNVYFSLSPPAVLEFELDQEWNARAAFTNEILINQI